ncbi:MAG: pyridoxamine 5'-phosphate oxidase [Actinomycetota bacterium]|nr:pyridoxamine 5'-phosphate oxidase [Actinomycetota bacterium]
MVPWSELEIAEPEIAAAGRRLLEDAPGIPTIAFLATVGINTRPRVHPFMPAVVTGRLWAFVIRSPKQQDLDRNGRYAIHSVLGPRDESLFVSGGALRVDSPHERSEVGDHMPYNDIDDRHVLYEFRIDRASWTMWTTPTTPLHRKWKVGDARP